MISSIVEEHALEAAFLWELRDRASIAPHWNRAGLRHLDSRVEAHLDGLRVAGPIGREVVDAQSLDEPGNVFAAAVLAAEAGDLERIATLLDAVVGTRPLERALVAALGWIDASRMKHVAEPMLGAAPAALRRIGIAAYAAHRCDPGPAIVQALLAADAALVATALRAAGRLGRMDVRTEVHDALASNDAAVRLEAAIAGTLLGDAAATPVAWELAGATAESARATGSRDAERAVAAAVARTPTSEASWRLETMSGWPDKKRTAITGAAALGDPAALGWLADVLSDADHARAAASAIAAITGASIAGPLAGRPPENAPGPNDDPNDDDVAPHPDEPLAWPEPDRVRAFCAERRASMPAGVRHVGGRPWSFEVLEEVVALGSQRDRAFAAFELAAARPGTPMIETRARADR